MFERLHGLTAAVLCEVALVAVSVFGDRFQRLFEGDLRWFAFADSLVHGAIGFLSWAVFTGSFWKPRELFQCMACALLAMGLDVDHFLTARSFAIKKAVSLQTRPPLHMTTLIPIIAVCIYFICRMMSSKASGTITLLFMISWLSHHIRDGLRRGLWLWPFGGTPPLPFWMYTLFIAALPLFLKTLKYFCCQQVSVELEACTDNHSQVASWPCLKG